MAASWETAMLESARTLAIRGAITLATGAELPLTGADIRAVSLREGAEGAIIPGATPGAHCDLTLVNAGGAWLQGGSVLRERTLMGATVALELGVLLSGGAYEYKPLCAFVVDETRAEERGAVIRLSGSDAATDALLAPFTDAQTYPRTLSQTLAHIAAQAGVTVTGELACNASAVLSAKPDWGEYCTLRQALSYVCAAGGCYVRAARDGAAAITPVCGGGAFTLSPAQYTALSLGGAQFAFNRVAISPIGGGDDVEAAINADLLRSADNTLAFSGNPVLDAAIADLPAICQGLVAALTGFSLESARLTWRGDPRAYPGDAITLTDTRGRERALRVRSQTITFADGLSFESECGVPPSSSRARAITASGALNGLALARGTVGGVAIANGCIAARHVMAGSLDADCLSAGCVTADKLDAGSVTADKLVAGLIAADSGLIADGAIQTAQIADGSITDAKIVTLTASKLTAGTIDASQITVNNLVADNITTGTINGARIPVLGSNKLQDGAVTRAKLANNTVTADKIVSGAVTTSKLAANAVIANRIAANAVLAAHIKAGEIDTAHLKAGAVHAAQISDIDGPLRIVAGGSLDVASAVTRFATDDFTITDAAGERELFSVDDESVAVGADVLTADKIQGDVVNTYPGGEVPWKGGIQATLDSLPKWLLAQTVLRIPSGVYNEDVSITGFRGAELQLYFLAGGCTVNGAVYIAYCDHVSLQSPAQNAVFIVPRAAGNAVVGAYYTRMLSLYQINLSGYAGRGTVRGVYALASTVDIAGCSIERVKTAVWLAHTCMAYIANCVGGVLNGTNPATVANLEYSVFAANGSHAAMVGTIPAGAWGAVASSATLIGSPTMAGSTGVPPAITTQTQRLTRTGYGRYQRAANAGGTAQWGSSTPAQGTYQSKDNWGAWCFGAALPALVASAQSITKATLTVTRGTAYGASGAVEVRLMANTMQDVDKVSYVLPPSQEEVARASLARGASYAFDVTAQVQALKAGGIAALGFGLAKDGNYAVMTGDATLEVTYTS